MPDKIRQRGKKVDVPPEDRKRIIDLSLKGHGYSKISTDTGYSRWTVATVITDAKESGQLATLDGRTATRGPASVKGRPAEGRAERPAAAVVTSVKRRQEAAEVSAAVSKALEERGGVVSAAVLATTISGAAQQARDIEAEARTVAEMLEQLWEQAEKIAQHDEALQQAAQAIAALKGQVVQLKKQVGDAEEKARQKAAAVYSESKLVERS